MTGNTMTFRALDINGDWVFGQGRQSYLVRQQAIAENIRTSLYSFLNDCFFDMGAGVDWWNLIGGKNPQAQQQIVIQSRQIIVKCFGVVRIVSITPVLDSRLRSLNVSYTIDTIYSRSVTGQVTISP